MCVVFWVQNIWSWKLKNLILEKNLKEQLAHQQNANTKNKIDVGYEAKWHPKIDQHISKMQRKQRKHKQRRTKKIKKIISAQRTIILLKKTWTLMLICKKEPRNTNKTLKTLCEKESKTQSELWCQCVE